MTSRLAVLATITLFYLLPPAVIAAADNDMQVRITIEQKDQIRQLQSLGLDIVRTDPAFLEILTSPSQADSLRQLGYKIETVHESAGEFYRSRLPEKTMGGYKTLSEIYTYLDAMIADHPDLVSDRQSIGTTIEGRDIWAVKISDNPNVDETEPEVLYTAAIHCREVATPEVLLYLMDHLTNRYSIDPEVQALVDGREIWFILVCNPDGYYYNQVIAPGGGGLWRMNRRNNGNGTFGVDLNRNFGYQWGYDNVGSSPNPGSDTYRGSGPFSEPETQALRDFELAHEFVLSIYYHSYANIFIFPWAYIQQTCPDDDLFRAIGDTITTMTGYQTGLVADLLYPVNGGTFDWEYGEQTLKNKVLGTSIEVGNNSDGFWPTLSRLAQLQAENLPVLLFMTRIAGNVNSLRPPLAPEIVGLPSSVSGEAYSVSWTDTDPDNPGTQYELVELQKRRVSTDPCDNLDNWSAAGFAPSNARAYSGATSLFSGSDNHYLAHLATGYPYPVKAGDHLAFRTYFDMEFYRDFAYLEVSTDGTTFSSIPGNQTSNFNPYGTNRGNGISGTTDGWIEADFDLAAFVGQQVWFRLTYETDNNNFGEGLYIDDVDPHLVFDQRTVISSSLISPTYSFVDKPMGAYYYQVRAMDGEGQWSLPSAVAATDVLGAGVGDPDLDGIANSAADLALYSLYHKQGLPAFRIYPGVQIGETDFDCDGLTLTTTDLTTLADIVVGATSPCYQAPAPATDVSRRQAVAVQSSGGISLAAEASPLYTVALETTLFPGEDSLLVDVVLTDAAVSLLGYQLHLEYDASTLNLAEVRPGNAIESWQLFDSRIALTGDTGEVTLAAVAQYQGALIDPEEINLLPAPAKLARLKFNLIAPTSPLNTNVNFVWDVCGDNALVCGGYDGSSLVVDSLALSRVVRDADGLDITGLDARYGGADLTCYYGLFGGMPAHGVDFSDTRIVLAGGCCEGLVGDVNGEGGDEPTIGDVSLLIDHLFLSGVTLACWDEADVNQSGGSLPTTDDITIGDVSLLIDHLFISGVALSGCL